MAIASSIAAVVALTSVPNENWATTSEIEFDEVDWMVSSRGTPLMAFSIGLVTCSVTSDEPAPGYGVTTVMTGKSMSGRSSCLRLPQAEIPAKNRAAGEQERDAPLAEGEAAEATHGRVSALVLGWMVGGVADGCSAAAAPVDGAVEDLEGPLDDGELVGVERDQQLAQLALVELAEALEERRAPRAWR